MWRPFIIQKNHGTHMSSSLFFPSSCSHSYISLSLSFSPFLFPFGLLRGARAGAVTEACRWGIEQRQQRSRRFRATMALAATEPSWARWSCHPSSLSFLSTLTLLPLSSPGHHGSLSSFHVSKRHGAVSLWWSADNTGVLLEFGRRFASDGDDTRHAATWSTQDWERGLPGGWEELKRRRWGWFVAAREAVLHYHCHQGFKFQN